MPWAGVERSCREEGRWRTPVETRERCSSTVLYRRGTLLLNKRRDEQGEVPVEEVLGARRWVFEDGGRAWCRQRTKGRRGCRTDRENDIMEGTKGLG